MVENKEVRKAEEEDPEMLTSVVDRSEKRVMMRGKEENVGNTTLGKRRREGIGTVRIVTAIASIRVEITSGMIIILMRTTIMAVPMCAIGVDAGMNNNFSS